MYLPNLKKIPAKIWAIGLFIFVTVTNSFAQSPATLYKKNNTYAIVVGISQYDSKFIPPLSFADADAMAFSAYLQSDAGGKVPEANIQILLNENATIGSITHAMKWLSKQCKPNDKAYIYFSGHGDVEIENDGNNGYLLAYNSPPHNYRNNAISVNSINELANDLTLKNQAQTVIITDACRSGKLAGNIINGKQLVSNQLKKVLNKEARLISSGADELSVEGKYWGGGRGVFSYYLIQGLQGLADANSDQNVQLNEITNYLKESFKADATLIEQKHKQTPITDGNPLMSLSSVNIDILNQIKSNLNHKNNINANISPRLMNFKKARPSILDLFMQSMEKLPIESMVDFDALAKFNAKDFPIKFIEAYEATNDNSLEKHELERLKKDLINQPRLYEQFNKRFIKLVHQKGQTMINAFIGGDLAELEKRQYYYSGERSYKDYLSLIIAAKAIMEPEEPLDNLIQLHEHYVRGLVIRLNMLTSTEYDKLLPEALQHQHNALYNDSHSALALNELGNLHLQLANYDSASYYFNKATIESPTWVIPWSNKIRLGLAQNNLQAAGKAALITDSLQPNLCYVNTNKGLLFEKLEKLLDAETAYLQAIEQNNVHYLPYERLANIYMEYGEFKKADEYFYAAESRKIAFAVNDRSFEFGIGVGLPTHLNEISFEKNCPSISEPTNKKLLPYYNLLKVLSDFQDASIMQEEEVSKLNRLLIKDNNIPLAHHYVGKYYAQKGTWQQATTFLQKAIQIKKSALENDVLQDTCLLIMLKKYDYDELEDYFLLADIYERKNLISEALNTYETIAKIENNRQLDQATFLGLQEALGFTEDNVSMFSEKIKQRSETPLQLAGYISASRMLVKAKKYDLAESMLLKQVALSRQAGDKRKDAIQHQKIPYVKHFYHKEDDNRYWLTINYCIESEVYNFYKQVTDSLPRYPEWHEKAGYFLYQRLKLAYDKLNPNHYKNFKKFLEDYSYPWIAAYGGTFTYPTQFILPGTNDTLSIATDTYNPLEKAIGYLEQYEKLMLSSNLKPEILKALAELNSWMGNKQKAFDYYQKAIEVSPLDKSLINSYANYLESTGDLSLSYYWMKVLESSNTLLPALYPNFIKYHIKSKSFTAADKYLKLLNNDPNTDNTEWLKLSIFKNTTLKNYQEAIKQIKVLQEIAKNQKRDNYEADTLSSALLLYAEARIYANQNNNQLAFKTLKQSLDYGFDYEYLLKKDPSWNAIKNNNTWHDLLKNYSFYREYVVNEIDYFSINNIIIPN